jgi:SAM-dependent methyltransferase
MNDNCPDVFGLKELEIGKTYVNWIYSVIEPFLGNRILEIGSGLGLMIEHLVKKDFVVASDINKDFLKVISKKFKKRDNIKDIYLDITKISPLTLNSLRKLKFDTVISLNTLEHIGDDRKALDNIFKILPDSGKIIIFVPAINFIYGSLDRSLGHLRRYSRSQLQCDFESVGFKVIFIKYFNILGIVWWYIAGKMLKLKNIPKHSGTLLNLIVPFLKIFEKSVKIPFGQSLIVIGEKIK